MDSNERLAAIVQEIAGSIEDHAISLVRMIQDPQDVNIKDERVELDKRILVSFHLCTLFDGGVTARVMASMAGLQRPLWFSGVAFRVEAKQELYADMFKECIRLLPNEILCGQKAPVSELSKEYLKRNYLAENTSGNRHFDQYALFCQLCETHVKGLYDVIGHKRAAEHDLLCQRLQQRGKMVEWWLKKKPRISLSYKQFMHTLGGRIVDQINSFYELPEVASIGATMEAFGSMQEDYSVEFLPIGGFSNRLITRDRTMPKNRVTADFFVKIAARDGSEISNEAKMDVFNALVPGMKPVEREEHLSGLQFPVQVGGDESLTLFLTIDPKAERLALTTRLFSLYTRCCPKFLELAQILRYWAVHMGLEKMFDEDGVSGCIFDFLTLHFMQQQVLIPVLNEIVFECSFEEFLKKPDDEQLAAVRPLFEQQEELPSIERLFQALICFYGCAFNRQEVVQIAYKEPMLKENRGRRYLRIMDPILYVNIAQMRVENFNHLDNILFLGAADFLVVQTADGHEEKLRTTLYGGVHVKEDGQKAGYTFLLYETKGDHKYKNENTSLRVRYLHGMNAWNTHIIRPITLRCSFCRGSAHSWRNCTLLQLTDPSEKIIDGLAERMTALCTRWFEDHRLTAEDVAAATTFIAEFEKKFNAAKGRNIEFVPFGSLMSGFGAKGCDFDLCVLSAGDVPNEASGGPKQQQKILQLIYEFCRQDPAFHSVRLIPKAKIPIVQWRYLYGKFSFHGDISCSNRLAIHNTRLLNAYSRMDERVAPLVLAAKKLFRVCDMNNASSGTFSSYAITIIVLSFLQQTDPPVLTCLQDESHYVLPDQPELEGEWDVRFADLDAPCIAPPTRPNDSSVGQLFLEFFDFLDTFDWKSEVVQVRRANRRLLKIDKQWTRSAIAVEDPFELSHNLTAGIRTIRVSLILKTINTIRHEIRNPNSKLCSPDFIFSHFAQLVPQKPHAPQQQESGKPSSLVGKPSPEEMMGA